MPNVVNRQPQGIGNFPGAVASVHNPFGRGTPHWVETQATGKGVNAEPAVSYLPYEPEDGPRQCKWMIGPDRCPNHRGEEDYCFPHRKKAAKLAAAEKVDA